MSNPEHGGHGHRPPFRLAPVESPEEEARTEVLREIAPKVRRKVREDSRLSAGAKFFFYALFDDCFWHQVGGHGTGQIFADIRTLAERYGHDEGSIQRWRVELVEAGWLWTQYQWPMTEWRLTPLMPAPVSAPHKRAVQMALGRATKPVGGTPTTSAAGQINGNSRQKNTMPDAAGNNARRPAVSSPTPVGVTPVERGHLDPEVVGKIHTSEPHNAHDTPSESVRASGKLQTGEPQETHDKKASRLTPQRNSTRPLGSTQRRETTLGVGSSGEIEGVTQPRPPEAAQGDELSHKLDAWRATLNGSFPSRLEKLRTRLQEQRRTLAKSEARDFLDLKLSTLNELLDGPLPPYEPPKPKPVVVVAEKPRRPVDTKKALKALREAAL